MSTPPFRLLRVHGIVSIVLVLTLGGALLVAATPASSGPPTSNNASASSQPAAAKQAGVSVPPSGPASPKPPKPEVDEEAVSAALESAGAEHALARLKAAGIPTTAAAFAKVADQAGVGGAVRVFAFAQASGKTPDEIVAMFKGGLGWGRIAKMLDLSIGPGIGRIMGHGHGAGGAKKDKAKNKGNGATKP